MNFRSDLYCYEDASGGWTTHVAGQRQQDGCPEVDMGLLADGDWETFSAQMKAQENWMENSRVLTPITAPYAGETFNDPTLEAFRDRLTMLRGLGYRFPDHVFEAIDEEIAERDAHEA